MLQKDLHIQDCMHSVNQCSTTCHTCKRSFQLLRYFHLVNEWAHQTMDHFGFSTHGWDFVLHLGLKAGWNYNCNSIPAQSHQTANNFHFVLVILCFALVENDMQVISECVLISQSPFTFMQPTNWKQRGRTHKNEGKRVSHPFQFYGTDMIPTKFPIISIK